MVDTHSQGHHLHHLMLSGLSLDDSTGGGRAWACFFWEEGDISFMMKSIFIFHIMTDTSSMDSN